MSKKLIVLSIDALQSNDLPVLENLPHFHKIFKKCSMVKSVREIYPTLTYPIHTTIITGVHPNIHGVPHNQKHGITRDMPDWSIMGSDWYWQKENIKVPTLVDAVCERGGMVATINWPCTAGDTRGLNIPEIWPVKVKNDDPRKVYEAAASPLAFAEYYDSYIGRYDWKDNNDLRVYSVDIAVDMIRSHQPDLLLHHIVHLDHARHVHGDMGPAILDCLKDVDIAVGRIIQATKDAGTYDDTNFVILGDHGHIDIQQAFNLNVLFAQKGLITLNDQGQPVDYIAYSFSAGFSTHIFLKNPQDAQAVERVEQVLQEAKTQYPQLIETVYTAQQVLQQEGLGGEFSFVLEGTEGTLFYNSLTESLIVPRTSPEYHLYSATHGHSPDKGFKPPFMAFGPDVLQGVTIEKGDMLSMCPTMAALAGVSMPHMTGHPFPMLKSMQ